MKKDRTMLTRLRILGAALLALVLVAVPAHAQTALTQTTLGAAIADSQVTTVAVASATGIVAPIGNQFQTYLLADRELMAVRAINGTNISVFRGSAQSRPTPHNSGAVVTVVTPLSISTFIPAGSCTRANLPYVPVIIAGSPDGGSDIGLMFDCVGSQWMSTNASTLPVLGATVASASSITPTGSYFKLSGTTAVNTIVLPAGWAAGQCLEIEPTGLGSFGTSGNIGLASTSVVGKVLTECWNGTKWQPSY